MMQDTIYVETTIPSFYYEVHNDPEMVARRQWTRDWWKRVSGQHLLVTSAAVVGELQSGDFPSRDVTPA